MEWYCVIRVLFFCIVCSLLNIKGYNQIKRFSIKGSVSDTASYSIRGATVSLFREAVVVKRVLSTEKGFEFNSISSGNYLLIVSFSGYRSDSIKLNLAGPDKVYNTGTIKLRPAFNELQEFVVEAPPVSSRGDTIVYNASAFKVRVNSSVEEMFKKLPGFEVDENGSITCQGKSVKSIYINGKNYFLNDPKLISQRLTADMISKVEVFDATNKQSEFLKVKDPNSSKIINLKLKKGVDISLMTKVYAGITDKKLYSAGIIPSSFVNSRTLFANINSNNLNNLFTGQEKTNIIPSGRETYTGASINYSNTWSPRVKGNINNSGNYHGIKTISNGSRQAFLNDSSLYSNRQSNSYNKGYNNSLNAEFEFVLDPLNTSFLSYKPGLEISQNNIISESNFSQGIQKIQETYLASKGSTRENIKDNIVTVSNNMDWSKKYKRRLLNMSIAQQNTSFNSKSYLNTTTLLYPKGGDSSEILVDQKRDMHSSNGGYSLYLSDNEKITDKSFIKLSYRFGLDVSKTNQFSYNYNAGTGEYDHLDTLTTNDSKNQNRSHEVIIGYSAGKKFRYNFGGGFTQTLLSVSDYTRNDFLNHNFLNWVGDASLSYGSSFMKEMSLSYSVRSRAPNFMEWRLLTDIRNPLYICTGNPNLNPEINHSLKFNYSKNNFKAGKSFSISLIGTYKDNTILPSIELLPGGVEKSSYINAGGLYGIGADLRCDFPLGSIKRGRASAGSNINYDQNLNFVNGSSNKGESWKFRQFARINYNASKKVSVVMNASWNYNYAYSPLQTRNNNSFSQQYGMTTNIELPLSMQFSTNFNLNNMSAQANIPSTTIMFWNAWLVKNVFHNKRGELRFSVFDILNDNKGLFQYNANNTISREEKNTPGRQFLLSLIYNLRNTGQNE